MEMYELSQLNPSLAGYLHRFHTRVFHAILVTKPYLVALTNYLCMVVSYTAITSYDLHSIGSKFCVVKQSTIYGSKRIYQERPLLATFDM